MATGLLASCPLWYPFLGTLSAPFGQWLHAAPAVLFGIALGLYTQAHKALFLGGTALVIALTGVFLTPGPEIQVTYSLGIVATLVVVFLGDRIVPPSLNVQGLASCTLGIYMSHMVWVRVFNQITGRGTWTTAICAAVMSCAIVWVLRRAIPKSRLVLG